MPDQKTGAIALVIATGLLISTAAKPLYAEPTGKQIAESNKKSLAITPQGIGSLSIKTALDEAVLRNALPGYQLKKSTRGSQAEPYEVFEYYRQDKLAVEVHPDATKQRILSIIVLDNAIAAPKNARIGMSYREVAQKNPGIACSPGVEAASKQVICMLRSAQTLKYVFAPSNWRGSEAAVPPKDILNRATLVKIALVFR